MADGNQLKVIKEGVEVWNTWRHEFPEVKVDLSRTNLIEVDLRGAMLYKADLSRSCLSKADLSNANLIAADLSGADLYLAKLKEAQMRRTEMWGTNLGGADLGSANLSRADLYLADLSRANLSSANLQNANLSGANLSGANLSKADLNSANLNASVFGEAELSGVNLQNTTLVQTNFHNATLTGCKIYGISVWGLKGTPKDQSNLIITPEGEAEITVDDLQVAQFIYLLLNNRNVRNVIDTLTSKAVLILGRFTDERKALLDAIHSELRSRKYLPILFDFSGPQSRDITETVSTLAHMARFVIADITDAKSIPQELQAVVPNLPSVPVQPMLLSSQQEYGMFEHFKRYPWVLPTYYYQDIQELIYSLPERILNPLEAKVKELTRK